MASYRRSEIVSGLFIVLAVAVFALFAFKVGPLRGLKLFGGKTHDCVTYLPTVQTLAGEAKVAVSGQRVGRVTEIQIAKVADVEAFWKDRVLPIDYPKPHESIWMRVEFAVEDKFDLTLGSDAHVKLDQDGLLGVHFLSLVPGERAGAMRLASLKKGDRIEIVSQPVGGFSALIRQGENLIKKLEGILADVQTTLLSEDNKRIIAGMPGQLGGILRHVDDLGVKLNKLLENDPTADNVHSLLLKPANELLVNLNGNLNKLFEHVLQQTLKEADEVLASIKPVTANAERALARADSMLATLEPNLVALATDARTLLATLNDRTKSLTAQLDTVLKSADLLLHSGNDMILENRPALAATLSTLQRTMWEAEMLVRKIRSNPAVVLWGDDEKILTPWPMDATGARRAGRAQPYGQRDEKDAGK